MKNGPTRSRRPTSRRGHTLVESILVLTIVGIVAAVSVAALYRFRRASALEAAARLGRAALVRARMEAVHRGGRVRIRRERARPPELVLRDGNEALIARVALAPGGAGLDSAELRRSTLSFNARGQAAPGSLYLYGRGRGIRLVVNFVGRIRREDFRIP